MIKAKKGHLSKNFYDYCDNVALKMLHYAKFRLEKDEDYCNKMLIIGWYHCLMDNNLTFIRFGDYVLATLLNKLGFSYTIVEKVERFVRYPLTSFVETRKINNVKYYKIESTYFDSPEIRLLAFAHMTTDEQTGSWCTFNEKLESIKNKYGIDSADYEIHKELIDQLREWNFDDSISAKDYELAYKTYQENHSRAYVCSMYMLAYLQ